MEVSKDELDKISIEKAEKGQAEEIQSEPSDVYIPPSEVVAKTTTKTNPSEMKNRGIETLTRREDREIVEKAGKTKRGGKFSQLYNGISVLGSEEKDEYSLMTRLAMFVNGDKEQLLRIFQSSKQFREGKGLEYYEKIADKSLGFVAGVKDNVAKALPIAKTPRTAFGKNGKV